MIQELLDGEKCISDKLDDLMQRYQSIRTLDETNALISDIDNFFVFLDGHEHSLENVIEELEETIRDQANQHLDLSKPKIVLVHLKKWQEKFYSLYNFMSNALKKIYNELKEDLRNNQGFFGNVKTFTVPVRCSC